MVINAPLPEEDRCGSDSLVLAVLLYLLREDAEVHTFMEYRTMLEEAGFSKITKHGQYLVTGRKPLT